MGKEAKGFDSVECCIKEAIISEEYANSFPLGLCLVKGVNLPINCFKRSPLEIVYCSVFKEHVNEIKSQNYCVQQI
jgi:hypothetical protein